MAYEILVIDGFGSVPVSARQRTQEQEARLLEIEDAAVRAYEQGSKEGIRRIDPGEGVVDVTTPEMAAQGIRAGVMAHEDTTGTVTITRRRSKVLQAVMGALHMNQDGGDTPQVETHTLAAAPGVRRVLLGPTYPTFTATIERQVVKTGTEMHVQAIVVRRNVGNTGSGSRPQVPMVSTPVGSR